MSTLTPEQRDTLIDAAFEARERSYSPYSKFRVGASLLTTSGEIFKGTNVENASYGGCICAERTALVKAVSEGFISFIAIAVVTDVKGFVSPCGICRQFIREFCRLTLPIFMVSAEYGKTSEAGKDKYKEVTLGELLPYSFGPEDLEKPRGDQ